MKTDWIKKFPSLAFFAGSVLFFSIAAAGTEINKLDVRFAIMLQEMRSGTVSLFPTIFGVPYADYFSPWFWAGYVTTLGGRWINFWSISLPSILLGSFVVAMTYRIGERMEKGIGFWSALFLLCTFEFVFTACGFGLDIPVAAACVIMLAFLQTEPDRPRTYLLFFLLLIALILIRGSLGMVVFGASAGGWLIASGKWKRLLSYALTGMFGAAAGISAVIGIIWLTGGRELLDTLIRWQITQRIAGGDFFYYFWDGFAGLAPVTVAALGAILCGRKTLFRTPLASLAGFFLLPMLLLSIPGGKHLRYLVPLLPAMALAGGWGMVHDFRRTADRITGIVSPYLWILPLAGAAASAVIFAVCMAVYPVQIVPYVPLAAAFLINLLLLSNRRKWTGKEGGFLLVTLCVLTAYVSFALPMTSLRENSSLFVRAVEKTRGGNLYFFCIEPDHDDLKYLLFCKPEKRSSRRYLVDEPYGNNPLQRKMYPQIRVAEALRLLSEEDRIILQPRAMAALAERLERGGFQLEVMQRGNLGHREYCAVRPRRSP